jgi:hypothetical protein
MEECWARTEISTVYWGVGGSASQGRQLDSGALLTLVATAITLTLQPQQSRKGRELCRTAVAGAFLAPGIRNKIT